MWQPISTAPKDGTAFLAVGFLETDDPLQQAVFYYGDKTPGDWVWATHDGPSYHLSAFTHWMPLPAPPEPTLTRAEAVQAIRDGKIERYCVPGQWRTVMVHGVPIVEELG